jgi:hypothetical protein
MGFGLITLGLEAIRFAMPAQFLAVKYYPLRKRQRTSGLYGNGHAIGLAISDMQTNGHADIADVALVSILYQVMSVKVDVLYDMNYQTEHANDVTWS